MHELNDQFRLPLAHDFKIIAKKLSKMGLIDKAVEAAEESVDIYRYWSLRGWSASVLLSGALNDLAKYRSLLGHRNRSLDAAKEAVAVCRSLSAKDSTAEYAKNLAYSLDSLAGCLSRLECSKGAIDAAEEAVAIFQSLMARNPAEYKFKLAYSLRRLARCLCHSGRHTDALHLFQELKIMYQPLRSGYSPQLALCFRDISRCLRHLEKPKDSLEAAKQSVSLYRRLVTGESSMFDWELSFSLVQSAICFSDLGHHAKAFPILMEAVEIRRRLADNLITSTNIDLAVSLCHLANCLYNLNR